MDIETRDGTIYLDWTIVWAATSSPGWVRRKLRSHLGGGHRGGPGDTSPGRESRRLKVRSTATAVYLPEEKKNNEYKTF